MNKRPAAIVIAAAVVAAAGLFAGASKSATYPRVPLERAGHSPSTRQQAADTISITATGELGVVGGPDIDFEGTASPFKKISFFAGSNWHFTGVSDYATGSECGVTPTKDVASCSFADPQMSVSNGRFIVATTISGTLPSTVAGEVTFADATTETFSISVFYPPPRSGTKVTLTGTGPSPSTLNVPAGGGVVFWNPSTTSHTVVFANGRCSLTISPHYWASCPDPFLAYGGRYAYTVDGTFPGTVVTTPWRRSVTLTARTHTPPVGTRLTLRGRIVVNKPGYSPPVPVIVLARHSRNQPFALIATARTKYAGAVRSRNRVAYGWTLTVRPRIATTYIAEVTTQRLCYYPASRCAHPQGQIWTNPKSRPFTVRPRQGGPR